MAHCDPFDVTVEGDLDAVLQRAKADVENNGGTFDGDLTSGSLSGDVPHLGTFQADYTVSGNTVTVTVTQRPLLVPCALIEAKAREYFGSA